MDLTVYYYYLSINNQESRDLSLNSKKVPLPMICGFILIKLIQALHRKPFTYHIL